MCSLEKSSRVLRVIWLSLTLPMETRLTILVWIEACVSIVAFPGIGTKKGRKCITNFVSH